MVSQKPILVFQHMPAEHPGYLFDRLNADGIPYEILRLDQGAAIPDLRGYRALWVLGGPMDVWEDDKHPWLIEEKRVIREAVLDRDLPYFGVCLGHQLLAAALGGEVGPSAEAEMGVVDIRLNAAGLAHPLLAHQPPSLALLQWHLAEVKNVPANLEILASSKACPIHGIALNDRVLSLQSHIEVSLETVKEWLDSPTAKQQLEQHLGPDASATFEVRAADHMIDFNQAADRLYEKLVRTLD